MSELPIGLPIASTNSESRRSMGPGHHLATGTVGFIGGRSSRLGHRRLEAVGASLSPRDLAILHSLQVLRLATSRHMETLHFSDSSSPLTAGSANAAEC